MEVGLRGNRLRRRLLGLGPPLLANQPVAFTSLGWTRMTRITFVVTQPCYGRLLVKRALPPQTRDSRKDAFASPPPPATKTDIMAFPLPLIRSSSWSRPILAHCGQRLLLTRLISPPTTRRTGRPRQQARTRHPITHNTPHRVQTAYPLYPTHLLMPPKMKTMPA